MTININEKKRIRAIIPARGNSKSIKKKNLIKFSGKPLIYWSIKQALNTKQISDVYVTSDNDEILKFSQQYGAKTIKRPKILSGDNATSESAILHALRKIKESVDYVVFMQATSPIRKKNDISQAIKTIIKDGADSLFSGSKLLDFNVWQQKNNNLKSLNYDYKKRKRRQLIKDLMWCENGSIYIFKTKNFKKYNNRLGGKISIYPMEILQSFEIDDKKDINFLEIIFKHYNLNK